MVYKVPDHILHSKLDDEIAILNLRNGEYYSLNHTGAFIWSLICGGCAYDEMVTQLSNEYQEAGNNIETDISDLLGVLKSNGLVEEI